MGGQSPGNPVPLSDRCTTHNRLVLAGLAASFIRPTTPVAAFDRQYYDKIGCAMKT
jgi:hypothetical protein